MSCRIPMTLASRPHAPSSRSATTACRQEAPVNTLDEDGRADKSRSTAILAAAVSALLICLGIVAGGASRAADNPEAVDVEGIAVEAYIYAYPLVTVELTRRRLTNVVAPADSPAGAKAPMGQFAKFRKYPDASYRDVTAPNADTLYIFSYFDVSKEPWVVSLPDLNGRYAVFSIFDSWTNVFADPGKRTTGTEAQTFAITGPGWSGTLPAGVREYRSNTPIVLLDGKIYCTGTAEDYEQVHALQDRMTA